MLAVSQSSARRSANQRPPEQREAQPRKALPSRSRILGTPSGGRLLQGGGSTRGFSGHAPSCGRLHPPGFSLAPPETPPRQGSPSRAPRGGELRAIRRTSLHQPSRRRFLAAFRVRLTVVLRRGSSCRRRDGSGRAAGKQQPLNVLSRARLRFPGSSRGWPRSASFGFPERAGFPKDVHAGWVKRSGSATFPRIALLLRLPLSPLCS